MSRAWLLACCLLPAAAQADRRYEGRAVDLERGTPMYEEHHYLRGTPEAPRERLVVYRCPGGQPFARKRVTYGGNPLAPEFALEDARFGYREGVQRKDGKVFAYVQRDSRSALQRGPVAAPRLVIDAGFDELVRLHWDELQAGKSVELDFLVPSRRRTYRFSVERIASRVVDGAPASVFRLGLNGVLGWFASPIEVAYRDADRRLMSFVGLTNIRENRDESYSARMHFPPSRESGFSAAQWDAALAEPLVACRIGT